jgi:hypothetical protein
MKDDLTIFENGRQLNFVHQMEDDLRQCNLKQIKKDSYAILKNKTAQLLQASWPTHQQTKNIGTIKKT